MVHSFRQKFNFKTQDISIRFAGEAGADLGGPQGEFLTLAMRNFTNIPGIFIGNKASVSFKLIPDFLVKNNYFTLGQLVAMAIITIGRGPECFNLMMVQSMFAVPHDDLLPSFDDAILEEKIRNIKNGDIDDLFDHEIVL